jgi:hypothetical protein
MSLKVCTGGHSYGGAVARSSVLALGMSPVVDDSCSMGTPASAESYKALNAQLRSLLVRIGGGPRKSKLQLVEMSSLPRAKEWTGASVEGRK